MTATQTALLALTGLVFAVWTYLMFAMLMDQRRRAATRTGIPFPGLRDALIEFHHWMTTPDRARDRRRLLVATLLLAALTALNAFALP